MRRRMLGFQKETLTSKDKMHWFVWLHSTYTIGRTHSENTISMEFWTLFNGWMRTFSFFKKSPSIANSLIQRRRNFSMSFQNWGTRTAHNRSVRPAICLVEILET